MTVDLLRRQAGNRRSSRFWDRGQWFCALFVAVLSLGIGFWSVSAKILGEVVDSTVQSCDTEMQLAGRWLRHVTDCEVVIRGVGGQSTTEQVETSRPYPEDTEVRLIAFRGTYADATLTSDYVWLIPVGIAVAAGTWWMGLPSRVDLAYGRHAAPRRSRRL